MEFGNKILETIWQLRPSEHTSKLVFRGNKVEVKTVLLEMMVNEVTVDFHMFGALVKNIIEGNINGSMIVKLRSTHVNQDSRTTKSREAQMCITTDLECKISNLKNHSKSPQTTPQGRN